MPRANLDPLEFESRQESLAPLVRRARLNLVLGSLLLVAVNLPWLVTCAPRAPSAPASLEVTSFQAIDAGDGSRPFLRLRFSAPAVADKEVGRPLPSAPAALLPAVAVRAHWSDRQTLVLVPERPLETGASYDVVLTGELAARTRKIRFEFVNRQLRLLSLSGEKPHSLEYLAPRPHLILMFDQDVRATEAARACYLTERASLWPIRLVAKEPSAVGKILGLTTAEALAPERQFLLRCAGLTAEKGGAPLTITHRRVMRTHGPFAVTVFAPWKAGHPPDEARVEVRFSTPVSQEEARRRIRIEPPVNGFSEGYVAWGGTRYLTTLNLQPNTSYKVVVDAALTDELGQRLGKDAIHLFTTGRHLAQLKTSSGIFALETSARGYPIWTRHLTELTVSCAMVSEESVAKVLSSNVEYEPSPRDGLVPEIRWAELGLQARKERLSISGEGAGSWKLHELDLPKLCASPSSASIEGRGRPSGGHKGLYLAELRSEELRPHPDHPWRFQPAQRVLVNRTDLGVLAKIGPSSGLVWVTSLVTGKPVAGAKVSVRSALGAELHRGVTDFQGRLPLPGSEALRGKTGSAGPEAGSEDGRNRVFVFVKTPADFAVVDGTWSKGVHLWSFGVNVDRSPQASRLRGFIQSDRGVYRPGEQVNFKGLLRRVRPGALPDLPTSRAVHVSVRDPKGQLVMEREVAVSAFGGFAFELPLSNEARTGDYYVTATVENQAFRERFQVEAFRKVTFEIEARPETGRQTPGEPLRVALGAKYLFGAPVSGGRVSWTVRRRAHVLGFPGFADFRFDDRAGPGHDPWEQRDAGGHTEHVTDGQAILDAQGRGSLLIASGRAETTAQGAAGGDKGPPGAPAGAHSRKPSTQGPEDYVASITVTDAADQSVSRSVVTTRHFTDRYLGISTGDYVRMKGRPFEIKATALALDGRRVAQSADLELIRVRWVCKWQGAFRSYRTCTPEEELVWRRPVSFPKDANFSTSIRIDGSGEHLLRLRGTDGGGRPIAASGAIWVLGRGEAFGGGEDAMRMTIVPSRKEYSPGDTAVLLPRTPMTGATALVTIERNGVMESFVTRLESAATGLRVPLSARHAPNVFATVSLVTGRRGPKDRDRPRFQMGVVELAVAAREHRLTVAIEPEKSRYEPGERVRGAVRVTDHLGRPARAEVSLSVADEGLLQLIAYQLPDPLRTFFAPWGIGVENATNWNRLARLSDPNDPFRDSGGDGPDSAGPAPPRVRSKFVNSAFWAPALRTDAEGKAHFSFDAPDNLTRFRMMAVAADGGHRFGKGNAPLTITKELLMEPVLPRFLSSEDRAEIGAVIHNRTDRSGAAVVVATAEGLRLLQAEQRLHLPARGSVRVRFLSEVPFSSSATVQLSLTFGASKDALRMRLPVRRPIALETRALLTGSLSEPTPGSVRGPKLSTPLSWSSGTLPEDSHLEITVDRTGLGELRESLQYLIEYPYGCLEQTLARFIPLAKVKDLATTLGFTELQGPRLQGFLAAGAQKVARHQQNDGLFSLWPQSGTYPHLSAFALYGLIEAKRAGVTVDEAALKKGGAALRLWAGSRDRGMRPGGELASMALVAFVLAELGQPDDGLVERLFEARRGLPTDGLAFLLRALHRSNASSRMKQTVLGELLSRIPAKGGVARALEPQGSAFSPDEAHLYFSSPVRSSAIALSALLEAAPSHQLVPQLVTGLKADRGPGGRWRNTQENVYSLVALADWARRQAAGRTQVAVTLGSKELTSASLEGAGILRWRKNLGSLTPGTLSLEIHGAASYAVRLVTATRALSHAALDRGFGVRRSYSDPATGKPLTSFEAGQLIKVRIDVTTSTPRRWVSVVDRLPAGFEPVNQRLATSTPGPASVGAGSTWSSRSGWSHRELLDDQVRAFADHLAQGTHVLTYLARATLPGEFTAAPAHAEEMYSPEVHGRSATHRVKVRP